MSCVKRVSKKTTALKSAHFQFESEDTKVLITSIAFITMDLSSLLEFLLNQLTWIYSFDERDQPSKVIVVSFSFSPQWKSFLLRIGITWPSFLDGSGHVDRGMVVWWTMTTRAAAMWMGSPSPSVWNAQRWTWRAASWLAIWKAVFFPNCQRVGAHFCQKSKKETTEDTTAEILK